MLLQTKLSIPGGRPSLVLRPRLIEKLNNGLNGKLILISAPAGFGKTTLLSSWISQSQIPFSWVTLDENDNDLVTFLAYLIAALRSVRVDIEEQLTADLHPFQKVQPEAILIPLINQIASKKNHLALVLDDYHLIESQTVHQAIAFLLEHQPSNLHLVISGRSDPPFSIAALRAKRELLEIRASDLRFSEVEGENLFNQQEGFDLSPEHVRALVNRTEGWVAGLQMATIALKDRKDLAKYIQNFTGSQEYIADYLTDEVISRQSEPTREFLLKTSILHRFSSELCAAVTERQNSQQMLRQLKNSDLFLIPLDDEGRWFRYHQLFADILQQRLLEVYPDVISRLYLRASEWFQQNDFSVEAINTALRGELYEQAVILIEQAAEETIKRSEIATYMRWIDKLPDDLVRQNKTLSIYYAWALLISVGEAGIAATYLEAVSPTDEQTRGRLNAVQVILAMQQRQYATAVALAQQALAELPEEDLFFRNLAAWHLSAALYISGNKKEGEKVLAELAEVSRRSGNLLVAVIALCRLAGTHMQRGALHQAADFFQQALALATDDQGRKLPIACEALIGLGRIFWEWYDLDAADQYLSEGIHLSRRWREQVGIDGYVVLAHIRQTQAESDLASQMIEQAARLAAQTAATESDDRYVSSQRAYLWLRQGDLQAVQRWVAANEPDQYEAIVWPAAQSIGAKLVRRYEQIVYARFLVHAGRPDEASELLAQLLSFMEPAGILEKVIEIHILLAIAFQAQKQLNQAIESLETALSLAQPGEYRRCFLDEGPALAHLLGEIPGESTQVEYAQELLQKLAETETAVTKPGKAPELIEPLSEREMEVLRLLETEMTVPQIAAKLHVAVSTMRSHVKNIYGKLDAHSRYEALSKAKEAGLL